MAKTLDLDFFFFPVPYPWPQPPLAVHPAASSVILASVVERGTTTWEVCFHVTVFVVVERYLRIHGEHMCPGDQRPRSFGGAGVRGSGSSGTWLAEWGAARTPCQVSVAEESSGACCERGQA